MNDTIKMPNRIKPESYNPEKPEILSMVKNAVRNGQNLNLPSESIIMPKDKIAVFNGDRWPYSNVEPAFYAALGLFYGRTEDRDDTGALINSDMEYSIHNVLTGYAFGLFYCLPDDSLSIAVYGLTSCRLKKYDYSDDEIMTVIKDQIFRGNVVYIQENNTPFAYFIWGYRDNGNVLLGYKFEHGNDNMNCSYDFGNPTDFDSLIKNISVITLFQPDGERLERQVIYKQALANGYRMLAQIEPPPEMDFARVHFGYGKAIYDEWIRQLEQANAENSEAFYFSSPIFPHFIALYENRLHLYKFFRIYTKMCEDENLHKALELSERLKESALEAAQIGFENKYSKPEILAMTNNERRNLLIDLLKKCRVLELEIAGLIKVFIDTPESYSPKKPEILNMVVGQLQSKNLTENVLQGIPHMGYGNPSAVCYIGSVMRLMDYLNDPIEADELFSLSGAALCFPWKAGLYCDEISILSEIPQRTFAALGYESEYIYEPNVFIEPYSLTGKRELIDGQPRIIINPRKFTKEFYIEKIKDSIDRGRPIIGFGLTELNFTCLITGYYKNGDGLYLRSYWSPKGMPEGYDDEKYYYTEDWYEKCCGLVVIGDKTGKRLAGEQAYRHIQESAKIFKEKETGFACGQTIYNDFAAFDDMVQWLLDDNWWQEGCDMNYRDCLLKPCGILLFDYYRNHLRVYLERLSEQHPGLVNPKIITAIERLGANVPGASHSTLYLHECVDPAITHFSMMRNRSAREKVAAYVERLKKIDQEIFDRLIKTEE